MISTISAGAFVVGLIIGSFLNVVIHRGPRLWGLVDDDARQGNLAWPGSYCPACKMPLRTENLIPLVSFIIQNGRCVKCGAPISKRYPLVEIIGAIAALISIVAFGPSPAAMAAAIYFWMLLALGVIDYETGYLPDALTLPLIATGLLVNAFAQFIPISDAVIGAAAGYLVFRAIGIGFYKLRGVEGLGGGDAKLLGAIGAWAGWQMLAPAVFVAAFTALIGILFSQLQGKSITRQTQVPFGPSLAIAGALALLALSPQWPIRF